MLNKSTATFFLFLTAAILGSIVINLPYHNFQDFLAQGDHGRDLYAAQNVLNGHLPYKDFWWVYGPLMPYYYALFFKLFGMQVPSILIGKIILNVAGAVFIFLGFSRMFSLSGALLLSLWFSAFRADFFFTYNHAGGIALLLGAMWMHLGYIQNGRPGFAFGALTFVALLGLVKINFALTALMATLGVVLITDIVAKRSFDLPRKLFYAGALFFIPVFWWWVYSFFLHGLSIEEIRQCLPYLGQDEPYNKVGPLQTIPLWFTITFNNFKANWISVCTGLINLSCFAYSIFWLATGKISGRQRQTTILLISYAALFFLLNTHEFLKSGVFYRLFWAQPLSLLLAFIGIETATGQAPKKVRLCVFGALGFMLAISVGINHQRVNSFKTPEHKLGGPRGGVYIQNDQKWIQTVVLTTKQLQARFNKDELFLALPYDCLYYYLTDKPSPTRQLIFFDHILIQSNQEQKIITELERKKIAGVLVSSRQIAREHGLGKLGETYCPLIAQYINTNFMAVARLGDWANEPGWAWNHGTIIFKRNPPPTSSANNE